MGKSSTTTAFFDAPKTALQEAPPAGLFFADGKSPCGAGNPAYGRLKNQRKPSGYLRFDVGLGEGSVVVP